MAGTVIVTKYSLATGSPATDALNVGEQAYSFSSDKLFIGETSGSDVVARVIGGQVYTDMLDHTAGTLTASSAIITGADNKISALNVDNLTLDGNAITSTNTNGDITITPHGSGAVVLDGLSHPTSDGSNGQFLKTDGSGNLSFGTVVSTLSIAADSGSNDTVNTGETITFTGGNGIDTTVTDNVITVAAEVATAANQGVATFSTASFDVTSGDVTVKALGITNAQLAGSIANGKLANSTVAYGGVSLSLGTSDTTPAFDLTDATSYPTSSLTGTITNAQLAGSIVNSKLVNDGITIGSDDTSLGATITDLNGLTSIDVDNLTLDGNAISTTDTNGNLSLAPHGTGTVTVPSGYEGRAGFSSDSLTTKTYVDSVANGLDVKKSVRIATTANLAAAYSNGAGTLTNSGAQAAITIDGVALIADDRILVKDQSAALQNGFYKVTTVGNGSTNWVITRTPDADAASELTAGAFTFAEEGTANGDNGYVLSTDGAVTLGTTAINFEQFSGAGQITAGNGLTKSGNTINVVGTADRISVAADAINIASSYVGQNTITTLGTLTTGTWAADDVAVLHGGTGVSSHTGDGYWISNPGGTAISYITGTQYQHLGFTSGGVPQASGTIDGGTF
jgi:hypothetical protein